MAKLGGGQHQLRHHLNGSILKINHARAPLQNAPTAGWRELLIARDGLAEPERHTDPRTIGTTTRYSFVLDPDGNWIEISQRAQLTGSLLGVCARITRFRPA